MLSGVRTCLRGRSLRSWMVATVAVVLLTACAQKPTKITVEPTNAQLLDMSATAELKAEVLDQKGKRVEGAKVAYLSVDPAICTVDASGKVTPVASGTTDVKASVGEVSGSASIMVSIPERVETESTQVTLTPEISSITVNATVLDQKGGPWPGQPTFQWKVADPTIATVEAGRVVAVAPGVTTLTVSYLNFTKDIAVVSSATAGVQPPPGPAPAGIADPATAAPVENPTMK